MRTKLVFPVMLLLAASSVPSLAYMDEPEDRGNAEEQQACTPDVFRLCGAYIPNVPSIIDCLKSERRNLSPQCRNVMDKRNLVRRIKNAS
jgi:hypothetical protein